MIEEQNESENGIETVDSPTDGYEVESADSETEGTVNPDEVVADEEAEALADETEDAPGLNEAADSDEEEAEQVESGNNSPAAVDSDIEDPGSFHDSDSVGPVDESD